MTNLTSYKRSGERKSTVLHKAHWNGINSTQR